MSKADKIFVELCRDILDNGMSSEGQIVRPKWEDGTFAHTIKKFGVCNRYDLREEFPAITLRKTAIKSATNELLWIWQKKSNNINDLKSSIWDEWADEDGSIGKAYGYQMSLKYPFPDVSRNGLKKRYGEDFKPVTINAKTHVRRELMSSDELIHAHVVYNEADGIFYMDQVDKVLYDLTVTPFSRRILTSMYNFADLGQMNLYPCAYSMTFNVTTDENKNPVLNAILNQRSQDILTANNWNVCQYAVLVHMLARAVGMIPGEFIQVISDAHIYDRHVPLVEELIQREQHPAPKFSLTEGKTDFYDFSEEDVIIENYVTGEQIRNIPVAV
ncbi:MAG: thymidylate synthase [Lachnospiraceae bacterium]|nr:thymidylate synthase [Lachnospiraceae bacterium]